MLDGQLFGATTSARSTSARVWALTMSRHGDRGILLPADRAVSQSAVRVTATPGIPPEEEVGTRIEEAGMGMHDARREKRRTTRHRARAFSWGERPPHEARKVSHALTDAPTRAGPTLTHLGTVQECGMRSRLSLVLAFGAFACGSTLPAQPESGAAPPQMADASATPNEVRDASAAAPGVPDGMPEAAAQVPDAADSGSSAKPDAGCAPAPAVDEAMSNIGESCIRVGTSVSCAPTPGALGMAAVDFKLSNVVALHVATTPLAVMTDGSVETWMRGASIVDFGTSITTVSPWVYRRTFPSSAVEVAASLDFWCARLANKQVHCWGFSSGYPQPVSAPITRVPGLDDAIQLSLGAVQGGCAVKQGGSVSCFVARDPNEVAGLTNATQVSTADKSCARRTDGTVWCWDLHYSPTSSASTPALPFPALGNDVEEIQMSTASSSTDHPHDFFGCARKTSGVVSCWGNNTSSQLGDGTTIDRDLPVEVSLSGPAARIQLGTQSACAVLVNGKVECWGWRGKSTLATSACGTQLGHAARP